MSLFHFQLVGCVFSLKSLFKRVSALLYFKACICIGSSQAVSRRTLTLVFCQGFCCRPLSASVRLQLCPEPGFLMSVAVPRMTSGGAVRIRIRCGELGTTKWKEGVFEIHERDNKINLLVKFNSGGTPRMFQVLIFL